MADEHGRYTPAYLERYRQLACGGVGTILTGYTYITDWEKPNPGMTGIYDDSFVEQYRLVTDAVHKEGGRIVMQLVYGGGQTGHLNSNRPPWGSSAVKYLSSGVTPREMTEEDIGELAYAFGAAARRARESGFDGVQVHGAHGYLLSQFLCPYYNRRTDRYGGGVENRARIFHRVIKAIRRQTAPEFPVLMKLNSSDEAPEGLSQQDSLAVAKLLAQWGCDGIEVSGGNGSLPYVAEHDLGAVRGGIAPGKNEGYFGEYAMQLAWEVPVPVILCGGLRSLEKIEELLQNSAITAFSLARPLLAESGLIRRWQQGDRRPSQCVSCNGCHRQSPEKRCIFDFES